MHKQHMEQMEAMKEVLKKWEKSSTHLHLIKKRGYSKFFQGIMEIQKGRRLNGYYILANYSMATQGLSAQISDPLQATMEIKLLKKWLPSEQGVEDKIAVEEFVNGLQQ